MKMPFVLLIAGVWLAACSKDDPQAAITVPTVTTATVTGITTTGAIAGGDITSDGGSGTTAKGVVYSTSPNPTLEGSSSTSDGAGVGPYGSVLTGLTQGTKYYVKAYATNSKGTGYGAEVNFTTTPVSLPPLGSTSMGTIQSTAANVNFSVLTTGGAPVPACGVVWDIATGPTTSLSTKTLLAIGENVGSYGTGIGPLISNTKYYVRAYATNSAGTAYSNEVSFTTPIAIGDTYQGGKVAYILQSGDPGYSASVIHGIIATASDQSSGIAWSLNTNTITTSTTLGTGAANTTAIITSQGAGSYAAKLCDDLVLNGYSDWYLPSQDELIKVYLAKSQIGNFAVAFYWSSTQSDANNAWLQSFNSNSQTAGTKTNTFYVRAVRMF